MFDHMYQLRAADTAAFDENLRYQQCRIFLLVGRDVAVTWGWMLEVLRHRKSWATSVSSRAAPGAAQFTAGLKFALVLLPEQQPYRGNCLAIVFSGGGTVVRLEMLSSGMIESMSKEQTRETPCSIAAALERNLDRCLSICRDIE